MAFEGQVGFVTGAASGMGRAAVVRMAADGMRVCAVDVDSAALDTLAAATGCLAIVADVRDHAAVEAAVQRCVDELGVVDLAFLNAGIPSHLTLDTFDLATYQRVTGVNIDGVVFGMHAVSRAIRSRGDGRRGGVIALTASTGGLRPFGGDPFYSLTKWALVGFARSVAPALAEHDIAVHTLCPGLTDTGFLGALRSTLVERGAPMISPAAIADALLRVAGEPIETTGTVWLIDDPADPTPRAHTFHDLEANPSGVNIGALLRGN